MQQCTLYNGLVNCNAKMSKCIERLVVIDFLDRVLKIRCQLTQYNHLVSNLLLFRIPLVTFAAVHICTLGLSRNKCKVSPPEYFYFWQMPISQNALKDFVMIYRTKFWKYVIISNSWNNTGIALKLCRSTRTICTVWFRKSMGNQWCWPFHLFSLCAIKNYLWHDFNQTFFSNNFNRMFLYEQLVSYLNLNLGWGLAQHWTISWMTWSFRR